jgi:heparin binding hemagglutinin HbhA
MSEQTPNTRIPAPLYAAAGAGDLALQQLRKLPTVMGELSGKAIAGGFELREKAVASWRTANDKATGTATELRERATGTATTIRTTDLEALREQAVRNTSAFAHAVEERAAAIYTALVAHGERVVGSGVVEAADVVNADIEATEPAKAVAATPAQQAAKAPGAKTAPATKAAKAARAKRTPPAE